MSTHGPIATHRTASGIPTGRLAVWWLLASEIFIFGGLIMCFLLFKFNNAPGFEDADMTSTAAGAFNTFDRTGRIQVILFPALIFPTPPSLEFQHSTAKAKSHWMSQ